MILLLLSVILLLTFFLRAYPRIILPYAIASDTYFHLYLTQSIIENKGKYKKKDPRFLLNSECNYPYFYHWLLSLFGKKNILFAERYSSAFFDTINCLIVYLFSYDTFNNKQFNEIFSLLPSLIYCIHPVLFKSGDEPRVHNGSSRVLAQTIYLMHVLGFYFFISNNSVLGAVLSICSASFIFFTSVFGIQVLLFFSLIFVFVFPIYPLLIILSFLLSIVITKGRTWQILKINYEHSVFLYKSKLYYQKFSLLTDFKNFLKVLLNLLKDLFSFKIKKFIKDLYTSKSSVYRNILGFHTFLIILNFQYFNQHRFLYLWMVSSVIFFILTKVPNFRFIGKAERYLEFAICPSFILFSIFFVEHNISVYLIAVYALFGLIGIYFYNKEFIELYKAENSDFKEVQIVFEKFNTSQLSGVIWTMHPFSYKLMFFSVFPILGYFAGTVNKQHSSEEELDDMMGNYPYPSYDLFNIIEKYSVEYIIITKTYLHGYLEKAGINENVFIGKKMEKVAEVKDIIFLKRIKTT